MRLYDPIDLWFLSSVETSQALSVVPAGQVTTADQKDASLFAMLTTAVQQRVDGFDPQQLANIAWAFATAGQKEV